MSTHNEVGGNRTSSFGWELISRRVASRLSQSTLAEAAGVSLPWLVKLEQDRGRPSDEVCRRLAHGFLPNGSPLERAMLDLRLRRAAGQSLVTLSGQRRPPERVLRLYARAAQLLDERDARSRAAVRQRMARGELAVHHDVASRQAG
ncbi:helix-turn-helix transcriptional regulator [Pseudonocardia sp. TRM90224]|uniref:helix-turn-helix transcriptional regulator n=1 Tax=Pseudonocardia sp. TRM90224 TaxID=2812678 RepID=UPI001E63239B|nr:helix-turn-helix transcriptional regulator [Pseudonocardia sp. TRM90224]